jgi:hypothetical protein
MVSVLSSGCPLVIESRGEAAAADAIASAISTLRRFALNYSISKWRVIFLQHLISIASIVSRGFLYSALRSPRLHPQSMTPDVIPERWGFEGNFGVFTSPSPLSSMNVTILCSAMG